MKGQVEVELRAFWSPELEGNNTAEATVHTEVSAEKKGETETSSSWRPNPNRKPLQSLNKRSKFHLQKNCCIKTNVLLFSFRNIYYTNFWLDQDESSLCSRWLSTKDKCIVSRKRKHQPGLLQFMHIKCLVSNNLSDVSEERTNIWHQREKKKSTETDSQVDLNTEDIRHKH